MKRLSHSPLPRCAAPTLHGTRCTRREHQQGWHCSDLSLLPEDEYSLELIAVNALLADLSPLEFLSALADALAFEHEGGDERG